MELLKLILSPLAFLYGIMVYARNFLYDRKILHAVEFEVPIIVVGNLNVGGTGKTPFIEYLIRLLKPHYPLATLSRGYGRKTTGFRLAALNDPAIDIGDEPMQFKHRFPDVPVAVGENRPLAIPNILMHHPQTRVILLDDAFQHRSVKPGLSVLLTDYRDLFTRDMLLPAGRLREGRQAYKRAHVIVVTKCPPDLGEREQHQIREEIQPLPRQQLFFAGLDYGSPYALGNPQKPLLLDDRTNILLMTGIANAGSLVRYLESRVAKVETLEFEDHHNYKEHDMEELKWAFGRLPGDQKVIMTTEKDAMRLWPFGQWLARHQLPVYCQPVAIRFLNDDGDLFNQRIFNYLLKHPYTRSKKA